MSKTKSAVASFLLILTACACSRQETAYFDEGVLLLDSCVTCNGNGDVVERQVFYRDTAGNDTLVLQYSGDTLQGEHRSWYDDKGLVVCTADGNQEYRYVYEGCELVCVIKKGDTVMRFDYEKDGDGRIVTEGIESPNRCSKMTHEYDGEGNAVMSTYQVMADSVFVLVSQEENEYDEDGMLLLSFQRADETYTKTVFEYDDGKNIVSQTVSVTDEEGDEQVDVARTTFNYDFENLTKVESDYFFDEEGRAVLSLVKKSYYSRK